MGLKGDLIRVSSSNLIVFLSSVINGLVLPYILSIDNFANLKTYTLFASFIGFLHFGFVDGINIKYGGKLEKDTDNKEFKHYHDFFILFQFIILFLVIGFGFILQNKIIMLVSLAVLPINLQSFFLFYYQALGSFKKYSRATVIAPLVSIFFTLILVFFGVKEFEYYVLCNIIGYILSSAYLEITFQKLIKRKIELISWSSLLWLVNRKENKVIFISGIFILIGNILFGLYFDLGRWIIKFYFNNAGFANYSLGISLIGFVLIFINTINKTFYPHLFHNYSTSRVIRYKNILYVLGSFSLLGFFFLKEIVIRFLPKYMDSLPITAILITSIPGMLIVKSIYVNEYKIFKLEKQFMFDALKYMGVSLVIFSVLFYYFKSTESVAISSVISVYVWALWPLNNKYLKLTIMFKELLYISLLLSSFYHVIKCDFNLFYSFIYSLLYLICINLLFYKTIIMNVIVIKKNSI